MAAPLTLNERALRLADHLAANAATLRIDVQAVAGARVLDCGVKAEGGLNAGLGLARVCLAGQAEVGLVPGDCAGVPCLLAQVMTDNPVLACMASQYAGWQINVGNRPRSCWIGLRGWRRVRLKCGRLWSRRSRASTAGRAMRRALMRCIGCWRRKRIGWRTGGCLPRRSIIGGFSTSMIWLGCAWRTPRFLRPRTNCCVGCWPRAACQAYASITAMGC